MLSKVKFILDRKRTWLLQAFASGAPFPQGSVIAQDIFQNGLIPSDTDYRIFQHFGNLPGILLLSFIFL